MAETVKLANKATADLPEGYKVTDLGPLPEEWQVVKLETVFDVVNKKEREVSINYDETYLLLTVRLYGKGVTPRGIFPGSKIGLSKLYRTEDGDFVFSKIDARNGAWGFIPYELAGGLVSNDFPILRLNEGCALREFVELLLSQPKMWEPLRAIAVGTTNRRRIKPDHFFELKAPLPPISEQRAIAHVLSAIRKALQESEKVLAAARELKKSLMRYLFTYGPVPVEEAERVPLKETEIGLMPEHWQIVRLEDVVQPIKQIDPKKFPEQRFRYIDVSSIDNQQLRVVGHQDVLGKYAPSRARKLIKAGDVIFATVRPYLKRIALVTPEYDGQICSTAFCVLRADGRSVMSNYLFSAVSHDRFVDSISEYQRGSSYPAVTDGDVLRGLIPLPPLSEQKGIASILRTVDDKIQAEEVFKHALDVLFKALLHLLMTGRVRVKDLSLPETEGVASGASRE